MWQKLPHFFSEVAGEILIEDEDTEDRLLSIDNRGQKTGEKSAKVALSCNQRYIPGGKRFELKMVRFKVKPGHWIKTIRCSQEPT